VFTDTRINGVTESVGGALGMRLSGDWRFLLAPFQLVVIDDGVTTLSARVVSYTFGSGETVVRFDQTFTTSFVAVLRLPILPVVQFRIFDLVANAYLPFDFSERHDGSGMMQIDITDYLRSSRPAELVRNYTLPMEVDNNVMISYRLEYKYTTAVSWNLLPVFYGVVSAKQLNETYGQNLADYTPFKDEGNGVNFGIFLTMFKEPKVWRGYPRDFTVLLTAGTSLEQVFLDANKQTAGTNTTAITVSRRNVLRFNIDNNTQNAYIDFWLDDNGLEPPLIGLQINPNPANLLLIDNTGQNFLKIVP